MNDEVRIDYRVQWGDWKPDWTIVAPNSEQLLMIARIESEFASDGANRGLNWIQGEMLDCHESNEVLAEGAKIGCYERWQDVPDGLLALHPSAGWFLDDAGLRFYLPAIMRWSFRWGLHWSAPPLSDVAERALDRPVILESLTPGQRAVADEWNQVPYHSKEALKTK